MVEPDVQEPVAEEPPSENADPSLPTPPPEPAMKSSKKERAKVERTAGASWGFWGAAPPPKKSVKKEVKPKEDLSQSAPAKERPGVSRSKSDATARRKVRDSDNEVDIERSSTDKDKRSDTKRQSRGMGFSNFILGGPPPSRSKSVRKSGVQSRPTSRRPSVDVGDTNLPSPPPDDKPGIPDKAAEVMGIKTSASQKDSAGKRKRRGKLSFTSGDIHFINKYPIVVRDPYSLNMDEDTVMVNGEGEGEVSEKPKSKRRVRQFELLLHPMPLYLY